MKRYFQRDNVLHSYGRKGRAAKNSGRGNARAVPEKSGVHSEMDTDTVTKKQTPIDENIQTDTSLAPADKNLPQNTTTVAPAETHELPEDRLVQHLLAAYKLKQLARSGWQRVGVQNAESVAAHSWGVAYLATLLTPRNLNYQRVLELAILHDLAEVGAGDLTPYDKISQEEKHNLETKAFRSLLSGVCDRKIHLQAVFQEYQRGVTPEAKFVHALDKLDMALQAALYSHDKSDSELQEFFTSANQYFQSHRGFPKETELQRVLKSTTLAASNPTPQNLT
ncbi:MAG: HD domain-containing protein [bacterium]|nr:HD domain-containing protein [bacterium]